MGAEPFSILFRPEIEEDLKAFGRRDQKRVLRAIRERLSFHPDRYGKPLGGPLKGLRRIRVGDYRIAYQVQEAHVIVWAVKHRKDIYQELKRRFARP